MRIRMKSKAAGPEGVLLPEHEYELPTGRAKPLIDGGYAVLVGPPPVETATRPPRETTAARTGKPPGKPAGARTAPPVSPNPHAPKGDPPDVRQ